MPWFALAVLTLDAYFNNPAFRKAPAWDELGEFLNARVDDSDLVIQLAVDPSFGYYYDGSARDIGLPVKPDQPAAEITAALSKLSSEYSSIYIVAREQDGWTNAGIVGDWMQANMQEVLRTDASGLPIRQYMPWAISDSFDSEVARFDETVSLLSYETCGDMMPSGSCCFDSTGVRSPALRCPLSLLFIYTAAKTAIRAANSGLRTISSPRRPAGFNDLGEF